MDQTPCTIFRACFAQKLGLDAIWFGTWPQMDRGHFDTHLLVLVICRGEAPPSCCARPFCRLKAPLGLSLFRFAPQTRIVYFFVLGAISNMTVTRIYKPYSNQVMVLFQGKLISGWFNANTINAIAIISIIKPRILDIRFFMQSTSLSNWNC